MTLSVAEIEQLMSAMGKHRVAVVQAGDVRIERPVILEPPKPAPRDPDELLYHSAED